MAGTKATDVSSPGLSYRSPVSSSFILASLNCGSSPPPNSGLSGTGGLSGTFSSDLLSGASSGLLSDLLSGLLSIVPAGLISAGLLSGSAVSLGVSCPLLCRRGVTVCRRGATWHCVSGNRSSLVN
jgi:hypothetical protein